MRLKSANANKDPVCYTAWCIMKAEKYLSQEILVLFSAILSNSVGRTEDLLTCYISQHYEE